MTRVIHSTGCGVQSTAVFILKSKEITHAVFADPLNEDLRTYAYIEKYLKPFCRENGIEWVTVGLDYSVLEGAARSGWPTFFFDKRTCTLEHKIQPIDEWVRQLDPAPTAANPDDMLIGFSYDEAVKRISTKWDVPYIRKVYPLDEDKITRDDCEDIINDYGWPVPVKSGCVMCPIAGKEKIRTMFAMYPDEWNELDRIEAAGPRYPNYTLKYVIRNKKKRRVTLKELLGAQSLLDSMDDEGTCHTHSCHT